MNIRVSQKLVDLNGNLLKQKDSDELTLGDVVCYSLTNEKTSNDVRAYLLAKSIYGKEEVDIKAEDIVFIKEVISHSPIWTPIVVGQVTEILENGNSKAEKDSKEAASGAK